MLLEWHAQTLARSRGLQAIAWQSYGGPPATACGHAPRVHLNAAADSQFAWQHGLAIKAQAGEAACVGAAREPVQAACARVRQRRRQYVSALQLVVTPWRRLPQSTCLAALMHQCRHIRRSGVGCLWPLPEHTKGSMRTAI